MSEGVGFCPDCGRALRATLNGLCGACLIGDDSAETKHDDYAQPLMKGYRLGKELARGGMGVVHEAVQLDPPRRVAVKFLLPQYVSDETMRKRFTSEARAAALLDHPSILPIFETGDSRGLPWFTMKLVPGGSLSTQQGDYRRQWRKIAELVRQLADAVRYAHERGVLHRDIKPGNILFDEDHRPMLTDFGLAKFMDVEASITLAESVIGTPNYLSPEVAEHGMQAATTSSDIWGLGGILYELLCGRPPYSAESFPALLRCIGESEPELPSKRSVQYKNIPRDLEMICAKCLRHEPERRYPTAAALVEDLDAWLAGRPVTARQAPLLERLGYRARKHPAIALLSVLSLVSLLAAAYQVLANKREAERSYFNALLTSALSAGDNMNQGDNRTALDALTKAAEIDPTSTELRDIMITALATPSMESLRRSAWASDVAPAFDEGLQITARIVDGLIRVEQQHELLADFSLPPEWLHSDAKAKARLKLSGDGQWVGITDTDGRVAVWSTRTQAKVTELPTELRTPIFSADGQWLAGDATRGHIFLRNMQTGAARMLPYKSGAVNLWGFSPDGQWLAVSEHQKNSRPPVLAILSTKTWHREHTWDLPRTARVRSFAWQPDSEGFAIGAENFKIYHWPLLAQAFPLQLLGHTDHIESLAFHPLRHLLATQSLDGTTRLWDTVSGKVQLELPWYGQRAAFDLTGDLLCAEDSARRETVFLSIESPEICRRITIPHKNADVVATQGCWAVRFSPDEKWLACCDSSGLWVYPAQGKSTGHQLTELYCWNALFTPQSDRLIASSYGSVQQWQLEPSSSTLKTIALPPLLTTSTAQSCMASEVPIIAIGRQDEVILLQEGRTPISLRQPGIYFDRVAITADGGIVAASHSKHPAVTVWNTSTRAILKTLTVASEEASVLFSTTGQHLYIGCQNHIESYELPTFRCLWRRERTHYHLHPIHLDLHGDGHYLVANLEPQAIHFINPLNGRTILKLQHPEKRTIASLDLAPNGRQLAAFCQGHEVLIWNLEALAKRLDTYRIPWIK